MRVGTSLTVNLRRKVSRDHPHACGDKLRPFLPLRQEQGSSPCVWGQDPLKLSDEPSSGIIPMRVGTSISFIPPVLFFGDHPHACGDKTAALSL